MEFHNKLYKIDSELGHDDVEALKFLCSDNLPAKKLSAVKSGIELFNLLLRNDSIQENNHFLLCELLYIIRQHHLLRILNTSKQKVYQDLQRVKQISPYRRMLYEISENITKDELNSMAFLLGDKVPRNQKEKMSVLDLLSHLEKNEIITEDNISALEGLLSHISLDLLRPISQYKLEKAATQRNENVPNTSLHYGTKGYDVLPPLSVQVVSSTDMESSIDDRDNVREHFQQVQGDAEKEGDKAVNFEDRVSQLNLHDNSTSQLSLYAMNRTHRGYCLIINNVHFMKSKVRKGTDKDAEDLKRVLTWLGLEVEIHNDRDAGDIRNCLKEFQSRDHTDSDCFVCCILSHGEPGVVLGSDDKTIEIHEMMSYFTPTNCPTLANKPKLFFIQACQGKEIQNAYPIETDASSSEVRKLTKNIPDDADFLLGMSTVKGFAALRHIQEGAWYIQALCDNLIEMVPRQEDILSILTKVNKDVSLKEDPKEGKKQMPQPAYTLTKKLIFPVPRLPFACT